LLNLVPSAESAQGWSGSQLAAEPLVAHSVFTSCPPNWFRRAAATFIA